MNDGVLVLMGPTAAGKTELAIALAREFDAEIVGADSRQIYRDMPIGTAAPTSAQLAAAPHHLVNFLDPHERYSAARYVEDAGREIRGIRARGKRVIVTGGTGFYIRALTGGVDLAAQYDERLRERLAGEARAHDAAFLHEWLSLRDPVRAAAIEPRDSYRVMRALEVALAGPLQVRRSTPLTTFATVGIPFAKIALDVPIAQVDARIETRVDAMLAAGLVEEAERIGTDAMAATAVGYPQSLAYQRGWLTRAELRALLVRATRRFARRQLTWFRSEPNTSWVRAADVAASAREKLGWL
jgi:tRNA dimethylallyltransferase